MRFLTGDDAWFRAEQHRRETCYRLASTLPRGRPATTSFAFGGEGFEAMIGGIVVWGSVFGGEDFEASDGGIVVWSLAFCVEGPRKRP